MLNIALLQTQSEKQSDFNSRLHFRGNVSVHLKTIMTKICGYSIVGGALLIKTVKIDVKVAFYEKFQTVIIQNSARNSMMIIFFWLF